MEQRVERIDRASAMRDQTDVLDSQLLEQDRHRLEPDFHAQIQGHWRGAAHTRSGEMTLIVSSEPWKRNPWSVWVPICSWNLSYLSGQITRTPHSLANLSSSSVIQRPPNMGPMNRMAGNEASSKLLVVAYVTRRQACSGVSGSQKDWCKWLAQRMRIALAWAGVAILMEEV